MGTNVTVAIASRQRRQHLLRVLDGLRRQSWTQFEAVVVLDGSTDDSAAAVRARREPFALHLIEQPQSGLAAARNAGLRAARHPLVLFLDDDTVPDPDLVRAHVRAHAAAEGDVAVLGYCPPVISGDDYMSRLLRRWWERHYREKAEATTWSFTDFTDANMSIRRAVLLRAGAFDVSFSGRRQDFELGIRLLAAGVQFRYEPGAVARHHLETSVAARLRGQRQEGRDDVRLVRRHPDAASSLPIPRAARELLDPSDRRPAVRFADAVVRRGGFPLVTALERAHLHRAWSIAARRLIWQGYLQGVTDAADGPEELTRIAGL